MSSNKPNSYDKMQEDVLGYVVNNSTLMLGGFTGATGGNSFPVKGDALRYTEESGVPRWTNLGLVLGQLTWATGFFGTYNVAMGNAAALIPLAPTNGGGGCVLNPSSFLFDQTAGNGILKMIDTFSWSFYVSIQMSATCSSSVNLNFGLLKNGSATNILLYKPSTGATAQEWGTFGLVDLVKDDTIQAYIQDTNVSSSTLNVISFNFVVYAIRLLS